MAMAGDFRLAHEQREVGQSQESITRQPGQRARDVFESSCKQTQFSHTHHYYTYIQSARMWQIDRYAERSNFKKQKWEKKYLCCRTRVIKKKRSPAFILYLKSVSYFPRVIHAMHGTCVDHVWLFVEVILHLTLLSGFWHLLTHIQEVQFSLKRYSLFRAVDKTSVYVHWFRERVYGVFLFSFVYRNSE